MHGDNVLFLCDCVNFVAQTTWFVCKNGWHIYSLSSAVDLEKCQFEEYSYNQ